MPALRVLHASPTWFSPDSVVGGGERWVHNVIAALGAGAKDLEQAMVAVGSAPGLNLQGPAMVRVVPNERALTDPMAAISSQLWREFASFDLIHVYQSLTDFGAYACCVAASLGKTIVATDLGGGANRVMLEGGLGLADGIVSISNYAHAFIASLSPAPHAVMVGPIDTEAFVPRSSPPGRPAAVCVGRILPHKGIDRLIRALPPGLKLRVIGRVYNQTYRALLEELAFGKDVDFIHDASDQDLVDYYGQSTIFLQGSCLRDIYGNIAEKTELMGLTTLEAMACGLPVIVPADGGSLPELVTDSRFGAVFRTEDELSSLLRRHRAGLWPAPGASAAARSHAVAQYGLEAYGRRLAAFYGQVHADRLKRVPCAS